MTLRRLLGLFFRDRSILHRATNRPKTRTKARRGLLLEPLEARLVPSQFGLPPAGAARPMAICWHTDPSHARVVNFPNALHVGSVRELGTLGQDSNPIIANPSAGGCPTAHVNLTQTNISHFPFRPDQISPLGFNSWALIRAIRTMTGFGRPGMP
jgi:hypothetical protein